MPELPLELHLLLGDPRSQRPLLAEPLSLELVDAAPPPPRLDPPEPPPEPARDWLALAPEGPEGDALLRAARPLLAYREERLGERARSLRVPRSAELEPLRWAREALGPGSRHLVLLGGPRGLSFAFQRALHRRYAVGRLAFPRREHWQRYAEKLRAAEQGSPRPRARALFCALRGNAATNLAYLSLLHPALERARAREPETAVAEEVLELGQWYRPTASELLAEAADPRPTFALTVGLGAAPPRGSWPSREAWSRHGALLLAEGLLQPASLLARPFFPRGAWVALSGWALGTPRRSAYLPWLQAAGEAARPVLDLLSRLDGRHLPRVADGPVAALANPQGPLAVVGPAELAWAYPAVGLPARWRRDLLLVELEESLLRGESLARALHPLRRAQAELAAALSPGRRDGLPPRLRRVLWLSWHELDSWLLLGDPAAHLPLARTPALPAEEDEEAPTEPGLEVPPRESGPRAVPSPSGQPRFLESLERVVARVLLGEDVAALALEQGVDRDELARLVETYIEAGRWAVRSSG